MTGERGDDGAGSRLRALYAGAPGGRLSANVMHFARVLRRAGLPIGPGKVLDALRALDAVGVGRRDDFYWALHAVFVNRRDQREVFDQAFHVFWRNPRLLERMMSLLLPEMRVPSGDAPGEKKPGRRVADALQGLGTQGRVVESAPEETRIEAAMTYSEREVLRRMDFETMTAVEEARARDEIRRLTLPLAEVATRRYRADARGPRIDPRRSLAAGLRGGGAGIPLAWRRRRTRPPPLVILSDISGSMSRYARMLLHFMHRVTSDRDRVHSFVFGTRLTPITRELRHRDVDVAIDKVADVVEDFSGGTRIGHCLRTFNRLWARRVLAQGPVVLLITDGLDRDAGEGLEAEVERLRRSCRRLVWLNPLLRYEGYEPKALGARALLPHVDDFRPVHNLESLAQLVRVLSRPSERPRGGRAKPWEETA